MDNISRRTFLTKGALAAVCAPALGTLFGCCCSSDGAAGAKASKPARYKLAVTDWDAAVKGQPNPDVFETAKLAGLDGIQLSASRKDLDDISAMSEANIARNKRRLAETGLACVSVCTPYSHKFTFWEDPKSYEYLCSAVDATVALGADNILIPFFGKKSAMNRREVDGEIKIGGEIIPEFQNAVVEKLKAVAPYAESKGVVLCLEDSISADDNIKIIDAVASPAVKVYFDIYNVEHYGFDTVDALKKLKNGYIGQVHIKTKGGLLDKETEMPKNMEQIWDGLLDSDYSGWLVLEFQAKPKNMSRVELLKYNADALRRTKLFS